MATIISNMINSMNNFYSPSKSFAKFTEQFEKMLNIGLIDRVTSCIGEYSAAMTSANHISEIDVVMDGGDSSLINTGGLAGSSSV